MKYSNDSLGDFDWDAATSNGFVLVNAPKRKVAVFVDAGLVVVAIQEGFMSGFLTLNNGDETTEFCRKLLNASSEAIAFDESHIEAYELIDKLQSKA